MNDELNQSELWPGDFLDNVNKLVYSIAPDGTLLFANKIWYQTLGYASGEVTTLLQIIHPDHANHFQKMLHRVLAGDDIDSIEIMFVAKDGRHVVLEGNARCARKAGKAVAINSVFPHLPIARRVTVSARYCNCRSIAVWRGLRD